MYLRLSCSQGISRQGYRRALQQQLCLDWHVTESLSTSYYHSCACGRMRLLVRARDIYASPICADDKLTKMDSLLSPRGRSHGFPDISWQRLRRKLHAIETIVSALRCLWQRRCRWEPRASLSSGRNTSSGCSNARPPDLQKLEVWRATICTFVCHNGQPRSPSRWSSCGYNLKAMEGDHDERTIYLRD